MNDRPAYRGTLELTWTNKDQRLLAHEDGTYEWVEPSDYRVAEVRLLHDAGTVGKTASKSRRASDNLLVRGDALSALTSLAKLPEFADEYLGKVKLVYIDPPFNTGQAFERYDDALEHSVWLTMMRDRLVQIKKLLAPDGSVWVHLDDAEMPYCRVMMDEIFGRENFVATVVWQKVYVGDSRSVIASSHDYLLVYAPDVRLWSKSRNLLERTDEQLKAFKNPDDDPRGPWRAADATAQAGRATAGQFYEIELPSGRKMSPAPGRAWVVTQPRYQELLDDNRIWFGKSRDSRPYIKTFLSEVRAGIVPTTWWPHEEVGHNKEAKLHIKQLVPDASPFDTPKPERLMSRIVHIASNPGDIVLDCFLGSGTTAAVAHKMGRRWVGVERSRDNVERYALPRLTQVVNGEELGGITESVQWMGGDGFRVLDVAPSMFEDDDGTVVIAEWAAANQLGEAVAAQFGYEYELEAPFCGRKGRSRLAVIDGNVSTDVADLLLGALPEGEQLIIFGTSMDPDVPQRLRNASPGSKARKIPASILAEYALAYRWQAQPALPDAPDPPDGRTAEQDEGS